MAKYIGFVVDEGGTESTYKYALNKYDATAAPTVDNDVDEGYKVGSFWFDTTNDDAYVCLDNTDGAAVWVQIDAAGGAVDAADVTYTPAVLTDWNSDADPGDVDNALDQLAERVDDLEGTTHAAVTMSGTPDYITLSGQDIVRGQVDLAADVTGILPAANGGTGSNLSAATDGLMYIVSSTPRATGVIAMDPSLSMSPGADRLMFWDQSASRIAYLEAGSGLSITGTTITATGGTVTSVGLSLPSFITVSGSPVTSSGTLTGTLASQSANTVFAGPTSGGAATPTFRALVEADIPSAVKVPVGTVVDYGASSPPSGWLTCDGTAVSRTTYADLFAVVGTTFGVGDGSTTFNLPNFNRRVSVGAGGSGTATLGNTVGSTGGSETHTLASSEMPAHTHGPSTAGGTFMVVQGAGAFGFGAGANGAFANAATSSTGGGGSHNNMQPALVMRKIIKY